MVSIFTLPWGCDFGALVTCGWGFLVITNLTHFFMYLFISCLYTFRASQCSSSGDRIVLIHHLVWLVCVSDCLVCRSGIPSSHLHRLIVLIHHLVWLVCVSDCLVCRSGKPSSHLHRLIVLIHHLVWLVCVSDCLVCLTGIPSSHLHRLIVLIHHLVWLVCVTAWYA